MEFLLYLLVGVLIIFIPGLIIYLWTEISYKTEQNKLKTYFSNEGKKDLLELEAYLKKHKVKVKVWGEPTADLEYMEKLLDALQYYYEEKLESTLILKGYSLSCHFKDFDVFYNSKSAIVLNGVLGNRHFRKPSPSVQHGLVVYKLGYGAIFNSLSEIIKYYEKYAEPNYFIEVGVEIPMENLFWYVERPNVAGAFSGAIAGAIVFGGAIGALAGAKMAEKDQKKAEKDEIKVAFGSNIGTWWYVATGEYDCNKVIEILSDSFPKNRCADQYVTPKR